MNSEKIARLEPGDQCLSTELVRDHHRALITLVIPIVGQSEAEEVVQNPWFKADRAIGGFEGRSRISTWPGRIVINEARMAVGSRRQPSGNWTRRKIC